MDAPPGVAEQLLADAGAQLGRDIGESLDVVDGADAGAALGADYANLRGVVFRCGPG